MRTGGKPTSRWLAGLARWSVCRSKTVAIVGALLVVVSAVGIQRIREQQHGRMVRRKGRRVADKVINQKLGGTATAYLVAAGDKE